jgi:hypothetical protein
MPDLMVVDPLPRDRHPATALLVVDVHGDGDRVETPVRARR